MAWHWYEYKVVTNTNGHKRVAHSMEFKSLANLNQLMAWAPELLTTVVVQHRCWPLHVHYCQDIELSFFKPSCQCRHWGPFAMGVVGDQTSKLYHTPMPNGFCLALASYLAPPGFGSLAHCGSQTFGFSTVASKPVLHRKHTYNTNQPNLLIFYYSWFVVVWSKCCEWKLCQLTLSALARISSNLTFFRPWAL